MARYPVVDMTTIKSLFLILSMIAATWIAPVLAGADALTHTWTVSPGGPVDGVNVGDIDGDGRLEIGVVTRGGAFSPQQTTEGIGSLSLIDQDGNILWQVQTGNELIGFPGVGDFDGDGFDEYAVCEGGIPGDEYKHCYAYDGDSTLLFSMGPLFYPAMTNGGPSVADLNGDGFEDMLITGFGGQVSAFAGPMGTLLWQQDVDILNTDTIFGHSSIADIDDDGTLEVVTGGFTKGGLYIFNGASGAVELQIPSIADLPANPTANTLLYFYSSGPLLAQLDADADLEIVVLVTGNITTNLIAFDPDGQVVWWTDLGTGDFRWTSPVGADMDNDDIVDIFAQAADGTATRINGSTGAIVTQASIGSDSWMTPAMIDITLDGNPELVLASTTSLKFYDVANGSAIIDTYDNPGARAIYPPPILADTDGDGLVEMFIGTWNPKEFVKIDTTRNGAYEWLAFMGNQQHTGFVAVDDIPDQLGEDPSLGLFIIYTQLDDYQATGPPGAGRIRRARNDIEDAWQDYQRGDPHFALDELVAAMDQLRRAENQGADVDSFRESISAISLLIFQQYIDRSESTTQSSDPDIVDAHTSYDAAVALDAAADYVGAVNEAEDGAGALRNDLDFSWNWTSFPNNCPIPPTHVYHAGECQLMSIMDELNALQLIYTDSQLAAAEVDIRGAIAWTPDIVFANQFGDAINADTHLSNVVQVNVDYLRQDLGESYENMIRLYIDNIIVWRGATDTNVVAAEVLYAQGQVALAEAVSDPDPSKFLTALQRFRDARSTAAGSI